MISNKINKLIKRKGSNYIELSSIIGQVTLLYSYSEYLCAFIADSFLKDKTGSSILMDPRINSENKIKAYKKAIKDLEHAKKTGFKKLLTILNQIRKKRNHHVHSVWTLNLIKPDQLISIFVKQTENKDDYSLKISSQTINDSRKLLDDISYLNEELILLFCDLTLDSNENLSSKQKK